MDAANIPAVKVNKLADYKPTAPRIVEEFKSKDSDDIRGPGLGLAPQHLGMEKSYSEQPFHSAKRLDPQVDLDGDYSHENRSNFDDIDPIPITVITPEKSKNINDNGLRLKSDEVKLQQIDEDEEVIQT
jgi:hypothetical protein